MATLPLDKGRHEVHAHGGGNAGRVGDEHMTHVHGRDGTGRRAWCGEVGAGCEAKSWRMHIDARR